jgi:ABC-type Fe3+/spermidine/putrescine transport system ATPase subunit
MAAIELRGLFKSYGAAKVIDDLNLSVASGEFVTLLGPSGCGKSTTLKAIAGLIETDAGTILVDGVDVTNVPVNRRNIGMVFQSLALFPHMTVEENVMYGLLRRKVPVAQARDRVTDALRQVQLGDFASRVPAQLSGGQQQRVALARAFVTKPAMLLLDEPLGALDRKLREALQIEIRQLTRQLDITSIFVTHDQHEAIVLSDRIAVMNRGRIEQVAEPEVIFDSPKTPFVAEFLGVSNLLAGRIVSSPDGNVEIAGGIRLHAAVDHPVGQPVLIGLRPENAELFAQRDAPSDAIPCGVVEAIYQGGQLLLELAPLATREVRLRAQLQTANRVNWKMHLKAGEKIAVRWPAQSVLIYTDGKVPSL